MRTSRMLLALAALAVALTVAACGGDDDTGAKVASLERDSAAGQDSARTSTTLDPEDAMLAYARCMREEGIDFPDPEPGGAFGARPRPGQGQEAALRAAEETCRSFLPRGRDLSEEEDLELYENLLAFAKCMREAGFDVPDPTLGPDGAMFLIPGGATPNAKRDAAVKECRSHEDPDDRGPEGIYGG